MWISSDKVKKIKDNYRVPIEGELPNILLTDFLDNPDYKMVRQKNCQKYEWVKIVH